MIRLLQKYLTLAVTTPPVNTLGAVMEIQGNLVTGTAMQGIIGAINAYNIADSSLNFSTTSGTTITLTNVQNLCQRLTAGSATTVTIDSAYNLVNQIPNAFLGQSFGFQIATNASTTVATPTLSDTAVTLSGTTTVLAAALRQYQGLITQLSTTTGAPVTSGTTFTSIAQVGSTNNFTVTLGTNALVPVVGQVIYLGVTAGTLPPGWYPINKVTSATSFVIATPTGTVWTATAATVPGTTTVPSSQYTPGLQGVYSPLLTITGCWATVTATISV